MVRSLRLSHSRFSLAWDMTLGTGRLDSENVMSGAISLCVTVSDSATVSVAAHNRLLENVVGVAPTGREVDPRLNC